MTNYCPSQDWDRYSRDQDEAAEGETLERLSRAVNALSEGRCPNVYHHTEGEPFDPKSHLTLAERDRFSPKWLLGWGWKDADLEPSGCTGIGAIVSMYGKLEDADWAAPAEPNDTFMLVRVEGHKSFALPSPEANHWFPDDYEPTESETRSPKAVAAECIATHDCFAQWDWFDGEVADSVSAVLAIPLVDDGEVCPPIGGDPDDAWFVAQAALIERACREYVEREWEPLWVEGDASLTLLYSDVQNGYYRMDCTCSGGLEVYCAVKHTGEPQQQ